MVRLVGNAPVDRVPDLARDRVPDLARDHAMDIGVVVAVVVDRGTVIDAAVVPIPRHQLQQPRTRLRPDRVL
jgi:hypothetical protein